MVFNLDLLQTMNSCALLHMMNWKLELCSPRKMRWKTCGFNILRMLLLWLVDACLAMRLLHCKPLWCCDGEKNEGEGLYRWLRSEFLEGGIPVLGNEKVVEAGSG